MKKETSFQEKDIDFKRFLEKRLNEYKTNVFNQYSIDALYKKGRHHLPYNAYEVSWKEAMLWLALLPLMLAIFNLNMVMINSNPLHVLYGAVALTATLFCFISSSFYGKRIFKKCIKRGDFDFVNYFLRDVHVSEEVKSRFVLAYGEEELAILMSSKRVLTCADIFDYANHSHHMKEVKEKRESLKIEFASLA